MAAEIGVEEAVIRCFEKAGFKHWIDVSEQVVERGFVAHFDNTFPVV